ncbi:dubious [Schizosaccharomyces pombe]|uniref:Putative uncharacterized protein C8E11.08c n=1 Tax=Schizosaccharomyces pombe (strain 972 / ATCC 24843) TaxID=284812 RepID=YFQ8_SCHPO|nr:uncharacterized protein SPAC8E11.08c [Schizosaccharomyces pombe]A6X974.1 RecName: Full=Putative uncharacterized protein C8E11.08c [Schizosaccharomyces pombe 972h-]pir/T39162/ hypothetical protein SPAC8E11.08c - fission yeast (Schizosaccharomyces pombe) [Schizosaccharomyces pombe]CAO77642.1 dubious [Schizosaccharomyces pombe]|eukprot:NP_001343033.1 uncharacterized protein SPAC8E11.08c [Schizosaccharomyces pombe]
MDFTTNEVLFSRLVVCKNLTRKNFPFLQLKGSSILRFEWSEEMYRLYIWLLPYRKDYNEKFKGILINPSIFLLGCHHVQICSFPNNLVFFMGKCDLFRFC